MFLFKASGATYLQVMGQRIHAFQYPPAEVIGNELVLLSKNKEDCALLERQVQAVAKVCRVRPATAGELGQFFPGVEAAERWNYVVELYSMRPLSTPFNLAGVKGLNAKRYRTVQGFARLDRGDDHAILHHLSKTNPVILLDIINNAGAPE